MNFSSENTWMSNVLGNMRNSRSGPADKTYINIVLFFICSGFVLGNCRPI